MIRSLPQETRSQLRSSVAICSPCQCVDELVLNSLDAGATCVAVRVDLSRFWIQVVDNGAGIAENDIERIGSRYMTSKCHSLDDLQNLCHYGYRGEALASIRDISDGLEIQTREKASSSTFSIVFNRNKSGAVTKYPYSRPSSGTTVTVDDLFHWLPVRKKCFIEYQELERIRERLEAFSLVHPNVSLTLRNDAAGAVLLQSRKSNTTLGAFTHLFGSTLAKSLVEINLEDGGFGITGHFGKEGHSNRNIQYVFINDRLVLKSKIHKTLNVLLSKSLIVQKNTRGKEQAVPALPSPTSVGSPSCDRELYPIFVLRIKCPHSEYDITFDPNKTLVEFRDWNVLFGKLQNVVEDFLKKENLLMRIDKETTQKNDGDSDHLSLLSDEAVCEAAPGHAGYADGISSYNTSNCLASGTARRSLQKECVSIEDICVEDSSVAELPGLANSKVGASLTVEPDCFGEDIDEETDHDACCDVESLVDVPDTQLKDVVPEKLNVHCNQARNENNWEDQGWTNETLPTPKPQKPDEDFDCKSCGADTELKQGRGCSDELIGDADLLEKSNLEEDSQKSEAVFLSSVLDDAEYVTNLEKECTKTQYRSGSELKCLLEQTVHIPGNGNPMARKSKTNSREKHKYKTYANISSTDSDKTPDYSVDLPDTVSQRTRCHKRLSFPRESASSKMETVSRRKSCKKTKRLTPAKKRTSSHLKISKDKTCEKTKQTQKDKELKSVCSKSNKRAQVGHGCLSEQSNLVCLDSPASLFHKKRSRTGSSKRTRNGEIYDKPDTFCETKSPDIYGKTGLNSPGLKKKFKMSEGKGYGSDIHDGPDSLCETKTPNYHGATVPSSSVPSKMFKGNEKDQESRNVALESCSYENENPLEPLRKDCCSKETTHNLSNNGCSSSLWKFRQGLKSNEDEWTFGRGSQGCSQTAKTSRLWRRIRKMHKKTPAFLKYHGHDHNKERTEKLFRVPAEKSAKNAGMGLTLDVAKKALAEIVLEKSDNSEEKRRDRLATKQGQEKFNPQQLAKQDHIELDYLELGNEQANTNNKEWDVSTPTAGLNDAGWSFVRMGNSKRDIDRSERDSAHPEIPRNLGPKVIQQDWLDCSVDSNIAGGLELGSGGIRKTCDRPSIDFASRDHSMRAKHSDQYHLDYKEVVSTGELESSGTCKAYDRPSIDFDSRESHMMRVEHPAQYLKEPYYQYSDSGNTNLRSKRGSFGQHQRELDKQTVWRSKSNEFDFQGSPKGREYQMKRQREHYPKDHDNTVTGLRDYDNIDHSVDRQDVWTGDRNSCRYIADSDADEFNPVLPKKDLELRGAFQSERLEKKKNKSRLFCTEKQSEEYQAVQSKHARNLYQDLMDKSTTQGQSKDDDQMDQRKRPRNLYQDLLDKRMMQSNNQAKHGNILQAPFETGHSEADGRITLPDGNFSPYFFPLSRMTSREDAHSDLFCETVQGYHDNDRYRQHSAKEIPHSDSGFRCKSANQFPKEFLQGGYRKNRDEGQGLEKGTRHSWNKNFKQLADTSGWNLLPTSDRLPNPTNDEWISDHSTTPPPQNLHKIYDVMDSYGAVRNTTIEADLVNLGWLQKKENVDPGKRTTSCERLHERNFTESLFLNSGRETAGNVDRLRNELGRPKGVDDQGESHDKAFSRRQSSYLNRISDDGFHDHCQTNIDAILHGPDKNNNHLETLNNRLDSQDDGIEKHPFSAFVRQPEKLKPGKMQEFRDAFLIDDQNLQSIDTRDICLGGPRNVILQSQGFDPVIPPSQESLVSNSLPCTQGFEVTIADERFREQPPKEGCPSQSRDVTESPKQLIALPNHSAKIAKEQESVCTQKQEDNNFCVYTPNVSEISGKLTKTSLTSNLELDNNLQDETSNVAAERSQPQGKKWLLHRYNEEIERNKVSVDKLNSKRQEFSLFDCSDLDGKKETISDIKTQCSSQDPLRNCEGSSVTSGAFGACFDACSKEDECLKVSCSSLRVEEKQTYPTNTLGSNLLIAGANKDDYVKDTSTLRVAEKQTSLSSTESDLLASSSYSDIFQGTASQSQMSDTILKNHTPEWLKCSQDIQPCMILDSCDKLQTSQSILSQEKLMVVHPDRNVAMPKKYFDGSEDLFSSWYSQQTEPNQWEDIKCHKNSGSFDTQILPNTQNIYLPENVTHDNSMHTERVPYAKESEEKLGSRGTSKLMVSSENLQKCLGQSNPDQNQVNSTCQDQSIADGNEGGETLNSNGKGDATSNLPPVGSKALDGDDMNDQKDVTGVECPVAGDLTFKRTKTNGRDDARNGSSVVDDTGEAELTERSDGCCAYTCMIDPKSGRTMYIHLATGNSTYEKPTFTDEPSDVLEETIDDRKGTFTQHRFLSHGASPVMPRPKEDRKSGPLTKAGDKITKLLQEHKEKQELDRDVKWRESLGDGQSETSSGHVEKMFSEWSNPVFKGPQQDVLSIEMSKERRSATKVYNSLQSFKFTKDMFNSIKVIEQVDQKFIACLMSLDDRIGPCTSDPQLLVFVDQHAAHERIRLEKTIADLYDSDDNIKSTSVKPPVKLIVGTQQVRAMTAQEMSFKKIGINFKVETGSRDTVLVDKIPKCLRKQNKESGEKKQTECPVSEESLVDLLRDHVEVLQRSSGAAGMLPKPMLKLLWSQACHGAIKFGDSLSHSDCEDLITSLSACNLPFQCAHGRPSMIPIIDLKELEKRLLVDKQKPNLGRLRKHIETEQGT